MLFKTDDIGIDKVLVPKKESYGTNESLKYFIGYSDDDDIHPLCIKLPQMVGYVKCFENNNKTMSFKVSDKKMLKKYIKIWEKISNLVGKEFDSDPVYGDKYIKTKIRTCKDKVNTNFQIKKVPKENTSYKCLSLIMLHSVVKVKEVLPSNTFRV